MSLERRPGFASLCVLLWAASSCGGDSESRPDAPPGSPDAPAAAVDAPPPPSIDAATPDAAATNAPRLWLAGIGGSETNLQLQDHEPPPF